MIVANAYEAGQHAGEVFPLLVIAALLVVVIVLLVRRER